MSKSENQEYTLLRKEYPRTWRIWFRMNRRCELGQDGNYVDVEVCARWNRNTSQEQGFINFVEDLGPSEGVLEIDRINPFGDYEPANCRWVKGEVNRQNKRMHVDGRLDMLELAKRNSIEPRTFYARLRRGWTVQDAATLPTSKIPYRNRLA